MWIQRSTCKTGNTGWFPKLPRKKKWNTPWKFNSSPLKISLPKRKRSSSNYHFSGALLWNFGGVNPWIFGSRKYWRIKWNWPAMKQKQVDSWYVSYQSSIGCTWYECVSLSSPYPFLRSANQVILLRCEAYNDSKTWVLGCPWYLVMDYNIYIYIII